MLRTINVLAVARWNVGDGALGRMPQPKIFTYEITRGLPLGRLP